VDVRLRRGDREDPATNEEALAELRVTVMDAERDKVGRAFSNTVIEMVLANYPGLFTTSPPGDASSFGVYWPALVPDTFPVHEVVQNGERTRIEPLPDDERILPDDAPDLGEATWPTHLADLLAVPAAARELSARLALGRLVGARSGDKGGNANIGVWARSDDAYIWLTRFLTVERLRELMPAETDGLDIRRYELPNLRALNFVIVGLLGRGVAASTRTDPQAKGLGEYLRAKVVDVPTRLLPPGALPDLPPPPPV
jgi:hypothetical protein